MHPDPRDTIAAIGTASGGAARGMIRISGPYTIACVARCFCPTDKSFQLSAVRSAQVVAGKLQLDEQGASLPCELLLWPNERSYTRQPSAELHTIGSPPLLDLAMQRLCEHGARIAQPGEFTLRAFLAGRLDLTQAEAVLGVIEAADPASFDTALGQLAGGLSQPLAQLREQLLELLAHLEAGLDFVEEDITFISAAEIENQLTAARQSIADTLMQLANRSEPQVLAKVVLVGAPNAGKSSLFNALLEKYGISDTSDAAIVSPQAGTTRDFLTARLEVNGSRFQLIDTAGVEAATDAASIAGHAQEMTRGQRRQAHCTIHCVDTSASESLPILSTRNQINRSLAELFVLTKSDLLTNRGPTRTIDSALRCSSRTGAGIAELALAIAAVLDESPTSGAVASTAARCVDSLRRAEEAVQAALALVADKGGDELVAAEIRTALNELGRVVGAVYTDDVLDRIFSQFCIGK
jgi:tRNA modification GTPase